MTRWPTPTGPTSWERPGTGGGARRVQPDAHDLLVWVARPLDGGWPNRGSGGTLTLSLVGTAVPALGPFSDHAFQGLPLHQSMSGGCAASAGTTIGQTTDWTVSAWIYVSTLPASPVLEVVVAKQAGTGQWATPYDDWALFLGQDASLTAAITTVNGGSNAILIGSEPDAAGAGLHHVALRCASGVASLWIDGAKADEATLDSAVDWHGGRYLIGGAPINGASAIAYSSCAVDDVRVANVARPDSYFPQRHNERCVL